MNLRTLFLLALFACVSQSASAQWQWLDKDGRKVFSDRPPPVEVAEHNILRRPQANPVPPKAPTSAIQRDSNVDLQTTVGPLVKPAVGVISVQPTGVDPVLEARRKDAEVAELAKKTADEQKQARAKAENCQIARQAQNTLDSGIRIARVNADGERIIMDDATRNVELARNQSVIRADCR